ncbi:MAG: hypothetical protein HYY18_21605, partial [Planctomycetes bacterium]|nr:hypothetical protein [Planctomycetota bacterium]
MRSALAIAEILFAAACAVQAQEDPGGGKPDPAEEGRVRDELDRVLRERTNRGKLDRDLAEWKRSGRVPREGEGGGT